MISSKIFKGVLIALILGLFAGLFFLTRQGSQTIDNPFEISSIDNVKGNADAKITLIEYSDFQCPACANYYPLIKQLTTDFPNDVRIVYRHFPLTSIHPLAIPSAQVSEAAARQNRFWEMHDLLFQNQTNWVNDPKPMEKFKEYARILNLDMNQFEKDFNSKQTKRKISTDRLLANRLELRGTPTFFLNGEKIQNLNAYEDLKKLIEEKLNPKP